MSFDQKKTYLLLGSNLGNRELLLQNAIKLISKNVGQIIVKSAIYETAAWGKTDQPSFLNIALEVETNLMPIELLKTLLEIEEQLGRIRKEKWGARLIDIDIILYEDDVINLGFQLKIPHPEMHKRKFVLQPLVEIAPNILHPILKKSMLAILENLNDSLIVTKR